MGDLAAWADDLRSAADEVTAKATAVVKRGANNVKRDWKRLYEQSEKYGAAPAYPFAISYDDVTSKAGNTSTDIGPDKDKRQGALGNLIEYGSQNNQGQDHGSAALDAEKDEFVKQIGKLGDIR